MLEVQNLHKSYDNGAAAIQVLRGVNLRIEKGRFVSIVGPSGAGKSTLLHILGGLDSPTQGEVVFQGQDLYRLSDAELSGIRNKKIGFVFQFYHLLPEFTVLENILMPALISPMRWGARRELKKEIIELLGIIGLGNRIKHFPSELSGGEKQRVAIVRGLVNKPALLLCDEPTGNLDSKTGEGIIALLKKINLENKMTVVLVTHNLELAKIADNLYHLEDGVLVN